MFEFCFLCLVFDAYSNTTTACLSHTAFGLNFSLLVFDLKCSISVRRYLVFDTCSDATTARLAYKAFDRNLRFFSRAGHVPIPSYVHAMIGGMRDDVTKALNQPGSEGLRLIQVGVRVCASVCVWMCVGTLVWNN